MSRFRTYGDRDDPQLEDGDRGFIRMNNRLRPNQLQAGEVALSRNGRMSGYWQPRKGITTLSGNLALDKNPLRIPFWLVDVTGGLTITAATRVGELVTLACDNPFGAGTAYTEIRGLTGTVDPNGIYPVTSTPSFVPVLVESPAGSGTYIPVLQPDGSPVLESTNSGLLTYLIPGATGGETYSGSGRLATWLDDSAIVSVWGSCSYSDPSDENAEYIIIATNSRAIAVSIADGSLTDIAYPDGETIDYEVDLLQCFDHVRLFRKGRRSFEWIGFPATSFTEVPAGDYTQPQVFQVTSSDLTISGGLVTIAVAGNVTVNDGDDVTIYKSDSAALSSIVGKSFPAINTSGTSISFYAGVADFSPSGTNAIEIGRNVSIGGGFMFSPAPPWGVYHQRRLWVPFWYSQTGDNTSPVYTDRNIRDEIVASDILDADTYDQIINDFRITGGTADFTVGMLGFYDDTLLVFQRNSVHAIQGVSGALDDTSVNQLTDEVGCLARKTIAMHGPNIMFLSDNGVYSVMFIDQYNLRGVDTPLSSPIQPVIDRINSNLASKSVAIYALNRYYIAVPLDSSVGANDALGNNAILVYNFLNQGWESVDIVSDLRWNIINFHFARAGERNDLYAVNSKGGVHKLDSADSDFDLIAVEAGAAPIPVKVGSQLSSRQYDNQTLDRKRFSEMQIQVESSSLISNGTISFQTEDPDSEASVATISDQLGGETLSANEGASIRARLGGRRGQGGLIEFTPTSGRPLVHSLRVLSTLTNRQTVAQK